MAAVDISEIVSVAITADDNYPSRAGFGTPMVVAYHERGVARVETYSSLAEVLDAGYPIDHAVYMGCAAAFAQNPRPEVVKVGRRAGAPTQTLRLTPIATTVGLVYEGTIAGVSWSYTVVTGDSVATIIDGIVAAINASALKADDDAILTSLATSASPQTIDTEANGVVALDEISPPRKITVTRSSHADQDAVTAVLTGVDEFGRTVAENLTFANGGGDTITSTKRYARFTSLVIPAQSGTGGTTKIGIAAAATATDNTTYFDVAASVAGTWLAYQFENPSGELSVYDITSDPGTGLATDLAAILAADADWYGLAVADAQSDGQIAAAAAWAESNGKLYIADTADTAVGDGGDASDIASLLGAAEYVQTAVFYHRNGGGYCPSARWLGRMLPLDPGSETWALKTLAGLPVDELTSSERTAIKAKNANFYASVGGVGVTLGTNNGGVASSGRFVDLVRYMQYLAARIRERVFGLLANADKVPYTDKGVTQITAEIRAQLSSDVTRGALSATPAPRVTAPVVADVDPVDRAARLLPDVAFTATYAGAVQKVQIAGRLSI